MSDERLYLRPNIQVEPLVDQWYAWSHLIPPATAARNITERHLKILDSYIHAPGIHAAAAKNPNMIGGPFVDYAGGRVDEIRALRDATRVRRAPMLALSAAVADLDALLRARACGYSLEPLYGSIPDLLRGYVELVYDLNNNPSFRLIEPLLYRSPYYDRSAQSLMLSIIDGDDRPFILSTPRLEDSHSVHLRVPFDDSAVDALFSLTTQPKRWRDIVDTLSIDADAEPLCRTFFTPQAPPPYQPYAGPGVRWRYFGHACILLETEHVSLMFDPVLSYTYETDISRYTYQDLPDRIDYVVITHNHQDHVLFETLLQIRHRVGTFIVPRNGPAALQDPSLKLTLQACGIRNVIELGELESVTFAGGGGTIVGLPFLGEHADLNVRTKLAYHVRAGRHSLVFAADSSNLEARMYEHLRDELGPVDALFLGMECTGAPLTWLYGPLVTRPLERGMDESRRLSGSNYEQAMAIVERLGCREVYVYAMGQEPWLNHVMSLKYSETSRPIVDSNRLIARCAERGITAERLFGEKEILLP